MKKLFLLFTLVAAGYVSGMAQCIPDLSITQTGLSPADSTFPCIERTVGYSEAVQFKNFTSFVVSGQTLVIDSIRINNISNLPSGIAYSCNNGDCTYNGGENGCINFNGTTTASAGTYNLGFFATVWGKVSGFPVTQNVDSATLAGAGLVYELVVINPGGNCPNAVPTPLGVAITGLNQACVGTNVTLHANVSGTPAGPITYVWSTGSNADSVVVTAPDTVTLTIGDGTSSASDTVIIAPLYPPVASIVTNLNGGQLTATSTSSNNPTSTTFWVVGNDTNSTGVFTFSANGTYTVFLEAENACGSSIASDQVTVLLPTGSCTPFVATGTPGIYPPTAQLPCAVNGQPYDTTIYIENFATVNIPNVGLATVDSLRVDSISNLPCGLAYVMNPSNTLASGQTGCINLYGTPNDNVAQYHADIYISLWVTVPGLGQLSFSDRADRLVDTLEARTGQSLGIDFNYWVRVRDAAGPCGPLDTTGASDLPACLPGTFAVSISGNSSACIGSSVVLTANIVGTPSGAFSYLWSNGSTSDTAVITAPNVVSVTVTDANGSDSASFTVTSLAAPVASFTSLVSGSSATFTSTSTGTVTGTVYYIPGQDTLTGPVASYNFGAAGTYTVILQASNACGSDTAMKSVTITSQAGCTPIPATGTAGITPVTADLPCATVGVPYDTTIYIENFSTLSVPGVGTITVNQLKIDSIRNLPCGLDYVLSPANGVMASGGTGCINISGTTLDAAGQYPTDIYISLTVTVPGFGTLPFSGHADSLLAQLAGFGIQAPVNFDYWIRVINPGNNCPALDTTGATDRRAALSCVPGVFDVDITGTPGICAGGSTTLTASILGLPLGVISYNWSTGGTGSSVTVSTTGPVYVSVTDSAGTVARDTINVAQLVVPDAGVSATANGAQATATSTSTGNPTQVIYAIAGVDTNTTGVFTFTANGTYTVYIEATNACGSDLDSTTVTITGVWVPEVNNIGATVAVYPNPNSGKMQLVVNSPASTENYVVRIFTMQGREVYNAAFNGNINTTIELDAAAGIYFLHVNSRNVSTVEKLIIK